MQELTEKMNTFKLQLIDLYEKTRAQIDQSKTDLELIDDNSFRKIYSIYYILTTSFKSNDSMELTDLLLQDDEYDVEKFISRCNPILKFVDNKLISDFEFNDTLIKKS